MSESEDILRAYEQEISRLPQPFYGAHDDPKPGRAKITGYFTEIVVPPKDYEGVVDPEKAFRALAEKYGCKFSLDKGGVFSIRKDTPFA